MSTIELGEWLEKQKVQWPDATESDDTDSRSRRHLLRFFQVLNYSGKLLESRFSAQCRGPCIHVQGRPGSESETAGPSLRGTFIINSEAVLVNAEVNFYNLGRNIDELMRKFKANLLMSRKPAEVCPSKWKDEEDKTLVPSEELVGKVHEALVG